MNLTDLVIDREWTCVANAGHEKIYMLGYIVAPGGIVMLRKEQAYAMCQSIDRLGMVPYSEARKYRIDKVINWKGPRAIVYEGGDWSDGGY